MPVVTAGVGVDSVMVFGLGLIVGGLALLAISVAGRGHRNALSDGRRNRPRPRRPAATTGARPRGHAPSQPARSVGPAPSVTPTPSLGPAASGAPARDVRGRGAAAAAPPAVPGNPRMNTRTDVQGKRPRDGNQPRRPKPPMAANTMLGDTVLLQPVPAWSVPTPGVVISDPVVTRMPPRAPE